MEINLNCLSNLLKIELKTDNIGEIPYLKLNEKYVITEHFLTKELELNNLENYEWHCLSFDEISNILNFQPLNG